MLREHQVAAAASEPCWRTSNAGRDYQTDLQRLADLQRLVNEPGAMLLRAGDTIIAVNGGVTDTYSGPAPRWYPLAEPYTAREAGLHVVMVGPDGAISVRPAGHGSGASL